MRFIPTGFTTKCLAQSCFLAVAQVMAIATSASAAETVILRYRSLQVTVPMSDVEEFAEEGITSDALQTFLDQTPLSPELMNTLLGDSIPDTGIPLGPTDIQFLLFQLNKIVGDPLNREDLDPLDRALRSAYLDQNISVLELAKHYPESEVRLDLGRLERVHTDVSLFVQRITPLFNFFDELLPDMVCECEEDSTVAAAASSVPGAQPRVQAASSGTSPETSPETLSSNLLSCSVSYSMGDRSDPRVFEKTNRSDPRVFQKPWDLNPWDLKSWDLNPWDLDRDELAQWDDSSGVVNIDQTAPRTSYVPPRIIEDVVFSFGILRLSFSIDELTTFAQTGRVPSGWRFALGIANVEAEDLQRALNSEIEVDFKELDSFLNNLLGEYGLFQLGQVIHTPSRRANIQALRSTIIISSVDDGKVTPLELLQNYPAPQLIVEGPTLVRFGSSLEGRGVVPTLTGGVEDVLVQIQMAIADSICDCEDHNSSENDAG